jgi:tape measure domain-containing protein
MAKTVSDIILRLGVQGIEGVDRLKSAFRGLDQSLGPSQQSLLELRKSITEFAKAGDRSTQSIRGQLEAFKGLRDQATIGSRAYIQLTNDISRLTKELKALDVGLKQTEQQATRTIGQVLSQIPARKSDAFTRQIAQLNQELSKYSVTSARYAEILQQIQERSAAFGRAQQRQAVISAARGVNLEAGGPALAALRVDQRLPNTTAALRLQISELAQDLENLDRTSTDYFITQNRLADLQRELAGSNDLVAASYDRLSAAQDASTRRAKKLADIQEYYRTQGPLAPGAAGFRDPVTGAIIARGTREGIVPLRQGPVRPDNIFPVTGAVESMRLSAQRAGARPALGARGYAQVAGAAISGGIFGGPEGLLGGVAGGALGGVGGAFAGAAIGAQISGLRQQLAATADYAAQIGKLQIALRGVAGSQSEYTRALQAAASITARLNIPQEVAISGITRLSAAVKGAGGSVTDAELVFKNVTAAIKATGGGAEDVQGAITAMVQVFSKGKVSAEELSGQLGERLPGAVTMFAEANKMSLPELQDALKKGEVGLNELMNFVEALGVRFAGTALQIASSSADAGARLTVAFNQMKLEVGKALQPIGAEFQAAFAEFLTDITPSLIEAAKAVASGLKLILDNAKNIATIAKFAATFALVNLAMKAFIAMNGPISTVFLALQAGFARTSQQAIVAEMRIKAAGASLRAFALAAAAPIVITVAVLGIQNLIQARQELDRIRGRKSQGGAAGIFGGSATREQQETARKTLAQIQQEGKRLDSLPEVAKGLLGPLAPLVGGMETGERGLRKELLRERAAFARGVIALPTRPAAGAPEIPGLTDFKPPKGEDGGGAEGKKKKAAKEALDYTKQEAYLRIALLTAQESGVKLDEIKAQYALDIYEANKLNETPEKQRVALAEAYNRATSSTTDLFSDMVDRHREMARLDQDLNKELEDRAYKVGLLNEKEYNSILLLRERKRLEKEFEGLPGAEARIQAGVDLYRQEIDPTQFEQMSQNIAKLKQEMTELLNPVNQIVGAANAIGTAFSTSFTNVINGSQTTQQALASFFQNLANYFLDMAAQIIQKMIVMAILNQVVGLLPGSKGAAGGKESDAAFMARTGALGFAMGGVFDRGVKAYAMGGVVNKPTLFAYADGGAGRFGLMGEAGPEAILPLKRGADGKLGVQSSGSIGNIIVNVDATGTNTQADTTDSKRLGGLIGAAVQQELIKQKRPGGLLA